MKSRPLDKWRETLAMLAAYADSGEFSALCDMLAKRLAGAGLPQVPKHTLFTNSVLHSSSLPGQ